MRNILNNIFHNFNRLSDQVDLQAKNYFDTSKYTNSHMRREFKDYYNLVLVVTLVPRELGGFRYPF